MYPSVCRWEYSPCTRLPDLDWHRHQWRLGEAACSLAVGLVPDPGLDLAELARQEVGPAQGRSADHSVEAAVRCFPVEETADRSREADRRVAAPAQCHSAVHSLEVAVRSSEAVDFVHYWFDPLWRSSH